MKEKLVIVHGANALKSDNKYIQKLISSTYKHLFNFIPKYTAKNKWVKAFSKSKYEVIELKWSGQIIPYDIPKASAKLLKILNKNPKDNYTFLTESIGTEITLSAIEKSTAKNIKKIISICPVNKPREVKDFPIVFLKSKSDIFARFSNKFLWPFQFFKEITGNIENIIIENTRHDQFVPSHKIEKNKTLFKLIKNKMNSI